MNSCSFNVHIEGASAHDVTDTFPIYDFLSMGSSLQSLFSSAGLNSCKVYNLKTLMKALNDRPAGVPLVTVANHHSCMDEPLLWGNKITECTDQATNFVISGMLDVKQLTNQCFMRWAIAAHDICFTRKLHSSFFAYGKSIPVVRGQGVYQPGVDFSIDRLNEGHWVHIYPEGKVNLDKSDMRYKWGVGRMIAEAKTTPIVVPIYHLGMDDVLPSVKPYIPRVLKRLTVLIGEPIPVQATLDDLKKRGASDEEKRKVITDLIELHLKRLKEPTQAYHAKHLAAS